MPSGLDAVKNKYWGKRGLSYDVSWKASFTVCSVIAHLSSAPVKLLHSGCNKLAHVLWWAVFFLITRYFTFSHLKRFLSFFVRRVVWRVTDIIWFHGSMWNACATWYSAICPKSSTLWNWDSTLSFLLSQWLSSIEWSSKALLKKCKNHCINVKLVASYHTRNLKSTAAKNHQTALSSLASMITQVPSKRQQLPDTSLTSWEDSPRRGLTGRLAVPAPMCFMAS